MDARNLVLQGKPQISIGRDTVLGAGHFPAHSHILLIIALSVFACPAPVMDEFILHHNEVTICVSDAAPSQITLDICFTNFCFCACSLLKCALCISLYHTTVMLNVNDIKQMTLLINDVKNAKCT